MIEANGEVSAGPLSEEERDQQIALALAEQTSLQAIKREAIAPVLGMALTERSTEILSRENQAKPRPRPGTKRIASPSDKKQL